MMAKSCRSSSRFSARIAFSLGFDNTFIKANIPQKSINLILIIFVKGIIKITSSELSDGAYSFAWPNLAVVNWLFVRLLLAPTLIFSKIIISLAIFRFFNIISHLPCRAATALSQHMSETLFSKSSFLVIKESGILCCGRHFLPSLLQQRSSSLQQLNISEQTMSL